MRGQKIIPLTPDEVIKMRASCRLAAQSLEVVAPYVVPGVTTMKLNQIVDDFFKANGAISAPINYHGYPLAICTSVNDVVCHGLPDETPLKEGDCVNVDVTCIKDGFYGDTSRTFAVGKVSSRAQELIRLAEEAMFKGIEQVGPGTTTGDIGFAIDKLVSRKGYSTVKEIGGHGIGRGFHEDPFVPSFGKKGKGDVLVPWQCITVEPMVNEGLEDILEFPIPGSSIKYYRTKDGKLSAQFEHTVLVTDQGCEILTQIP